MRQVVFRVVVWLAVALLLTPMGVVMGPEWLIGDPRIDVWNHAWGFDWVARQLQDGQLPFHTTRIGGPDGGTLWFIDTVGALWALPITWLAGPALAYNLTLIVRIAWAGFCAQQLTHWVSGRSGVEGWVAGLAYCTAPFLLAELGNGISEVCATGWLPLTLWAAARAGDSPSPRRFLALGVLQGLTTATTFYYGLTSAVLVGLYLLWTLGRSYRRGDVALRDLAVGLGVAAGVSMLFIAPVYLTFRASLTAADALVRRAPELNAALMAHNAVDPRVFLMPGDFQSVNLMEEYGEPFIHTGYLRWSVVVMALIGLRAHRRSRLFALLGFVSVLMGLGPYLWIGGEWFTVAGRMVSLPFGWLRAVLPQLAITHPLRLSLGAQAIACVLAGCGVGWTAQRISGHVQRSLVVFGLGAAFATEGMFCSSSVFPLPRSPTDIPSLYENAPDGMVLDLPAEVGTTMLTSRYFWMQTVHGRAIPWTPDARLGSVRDTQTFRGITSPSRSDLGEPEVPRVPDEETIHHMRSHYGLVVVHTDLEQEAGMTKSYVEALSQALGQPEWDGSDAYWRLQ